MIRKIKVEKKNFLAKYLTRLVADVNSTYLGALGYLPLSLAHTDRGVIVLASADGCATKYHIVEDKRVWRYTVEIAPNSSPTNRVASLPDLSLPIRTFLGTLNDY